MGITKRPRKIILNEEAEANRLLENPSKEINYKQLFMICKLFYSQSFSPREVKKKICKYAEKIENYNEVMHRDLIDRIVIKSKLYQLKKSNLKIAITKSEIDKLKKLNHRLYKISLYILVLSKTDKFQSFNKNKKMAKSFKPYLNYGLKEVCVALKMSLPEKAFFDLCYQLTKLKIISPITTGLSGNEVWIVECANFDDKNIEFIIDTDIDFIPQIQYYCVQCGNKTKKFKMHDYCSDCYSVIRKEKEIIRKQNLHKKPAQSTPSTF